MDNKYTPFNAFDRQPYPEQYNIQLRVKSLAERHSSVSHWIQTPINHPMSSPAP